MIWADLRSSSPPLRHPCYFGIDIPQENELIAAGRTVEEIADYIGVDSLGYLSITGLGRAIASADGSKNLDDASANASLHNEFCYGCMVKQGWPFNPLVEPRVTASPLEPGRPQGYAPTLYEQDGHPYRVGARACPRPGATEKRCHSVGAGVGLSGEGTLASPASPS